MKLASEPSLQVTFQGCMWDMSLCTKRKGEEKINYALMFKKGGEHLIGELILELVRMVFPFRVKCICYLGIHTCHTRVSKFQVKAKKELANS